jgi:4'-phosphopantetheinyl transferase EntD
MDALCAPGVLIDHREITPGDETALLQEEAGSIDSSRLDRRRASGAARIVARQLLGRLGYASCAVPKGPSGEPQWPPGVVGSLAHDDQVAVAAVGLQRDVSAIGIDVEPAEPLPPEMLDLVATAREQQSIDADPLRGRTLFAAKEAVYKAAYPRDRMFLEFHDIAVDLSARKAETRNGRVFTLRYCVSPRIVVLATA